MARRKLSPVATIVTIGILGLTGFVLYKFVFKPLKDKRLAPTQFPGETEVDYVEVTDQNQA